MNRSTIRRAALAGGVVSVAIAAPAAAHTLDVVVSCDAVRFVYTDNARGEQRSIESISVDGAAVYGPLERRWTTTSRTDAFDVPVKVFGTRTVSARAEFVGSDGYRYVRTVSRVVFCADAPPPPPPPPAPEPVPPTAPEPPPPVVPPVNPPATPPTTPPVTPPRPPARPPKTPRPTACRVYAKRPANAITRGVPRPGQIRVRYVPGRGWVGFHRDRFVVVKIGARYRVLFVPGFFCGPRPTLEVTG